MEAIYDMLYQAGTYGGVVFGGFVRDVIVPQMLNPSCDVKFNDVDLWFSSEVSARNFVKAMGPSFKFIAKSGGSRPSWLDDISMEVARTDPDLSPEILQELTKEQEKEGAYISSRAGFILYHNDEVVTEVDVMASEKFQADDVNICRLTYRYDPGQMYPIPLLEGKLILSESRFLSRAFESISRREATILPQYVHRLRARMHNPTPLYRYWCDRLIQKYLRRGWTLKNPDGFSINRIMKLDVNQSERPGLIDRDHEITDEDRFEFVTAALTIGDS
jgi:hypothetical protein